ncbi:MAG: transcriptional regulator [Proteobacteria bacterium]|nr:transcriptional regulator [Pseudomonadota bacterium]
MSAISLIAVFAVLWILQIAGTAWQMRHYKRVLGRISTRFRDGFAGVGNARGRIGKGIILILVIDADDVVREALAMRGRTVFAKFRPVDDLVGTSLGDLRQASPLPKDAGFCRALTQAIAQIDRLRDPAAPIAAEPVTAPPGGFPVLADAA